MRNTSARREGLQSLAALPVAVALRGPGARADVGALTLRSLGRCSAHHVPSERVGGCQGTRDLA